MYVKYRYSNFCAYGIPGSFESLTLRSSISTESHKSLVMNERVDTQLRRLVTNYTWTN